MKRIALTDENGKWFDAESSEKFTEESYFNGRNCISKATDTQFNHQDLFYTKSGKWIICNWSNWQGSITTYSIISETRAAEWFLKQSTNLPECLKKYESEYEV